MFKSTNDFFDTVRTGNVSKIDLEEFVYKKTKKHNIDKLKTLLNDIEFYLFVEKDFLLAEITPEMWEEKHKYYKEKGEQTPYKEIENYSKRLKKLKGIDVKNEPDYITYYCEESLFFPTEFFCIYELEKYIIKTISLTQNIYTFSEDFINSYNKNLNLYFEKIKTSDELNYIEYELKRYKTGIESINYIETDLKIKRTLNNKEYELFGIFEQRNLFDTFQRQNNGRINIENFKYKTKENLEIVLISFNEILSFLEQKKVNIKTPISSAKHENIFSNNGFILFEYILSEYVKPKGMRGRLSDVHFFYWCMFNNKPQLIHQRPEKFKEWFFEIYKEDLGKIKTYSQVSNPDRQKHYSNALDWFKTRPI